MITMWTIVLLSMLVLVMASEVRITAELSRSQIARTNIWADTLTALNAGEMELLLEMMPEPAEDTDPEDDDDIRNPDFRFNGLPLDLEYEFPETVEVRIYDHAGKINLRNLTEDQVQLLVEKMMEDAYDDIDDDVIADLLAAWGDWLDEDDGIRNLGAEDDYYLALDPPYLPRQGPFESVEELLLVRGFDEWFGDVNLNAAFTLYSESDLVNLNTATREALALLPGLDSDAIDAIVAYRQEQDFTDFIELEEFLDEDALTELQSWVDFTAVSQTYTILVLPKTLLEPGEGQETLRQPQFGGFSRTVRVADYTERAFTLRVDPVVRLPFLDPLPVSE
jgi:general secretion pathway protein K